MMDGNMYRSYFEIDENYFPQISNSTIEVAQDLWKRTYPHTTFIDMLRNMVRVMERVEKRSIWISGAYGTGKSQCAYTLKKLLDVSEEELRAYWEQFDVLKGEKDLFGKLMGIKGTDVVTVYRYAGTPNSTRDLLFAVQESVQRALHERGLYEGEQTLKDSILSWIETDDVNWNFFDSKLKIAKWTALFGGMDAKEIVTRLRSDGDARELVERITCMAQEEGVSMLKMDIDQLIEWLTDVIERNHIKIVLLWDEFSDYFRVNRDSLADFQKLVELVGSKPFFFVPVTHETDSLFAAGDETWKKIRDRFVMVNIALPDNIAFDLIGDAFKAKAAARQDWNICEADLNSRLDASRRAVMKAAHIQSEKVIKNIMPLHPMSALVLKHIASAFQSNQRSMFDFIKSIGDHRVKAFQYFIDHTGPYSDHPLLTVDQLWDFFYVRGKADLATHIRMILDTFDQQVNLREEEQTVLKAILIMLAVDKQLGGGMELLQPTNQTLGYVFEGDSTLETSVRAIALGLKEKGILLETPLRNGQMKYDLAMLSGDQGKINQLKDELRKVTKTQKLVEEGELNKLLVLSPEGLKVRFLDATGAMRTATIDNFTRTANALTDEKSPWRFQAILAFAKDDQEAAAFRRKLKEAVQQERYQELIFIDALASPLGLDAFERYIDFAAMAQYYQGNNNTAAQQQAREAGNVLRQEWKNRIYNGRFILYTHAQPDGVPIVRGAEVSEELCRIVHTRTRAFDLDKKTTESYYKTNALKQAAQCGITGTLTGLIKEAAQGVLGDVWNVPFYWEAETTRTLVPSAMKRRIEERIQEAFRENGQVGISELCQILSKGFAFPPTNLMAFLLGFFLRPYAEEPYRYGDAVGTSEDMTAGRLAEMISGYVSYIAKGGKEPRETFIIKRTQEERAFYKLTREAWDVSETVCTSVSRVSAAVAQQMKEWKLPLWCLADMGRPDLWKAAASYMLLVQTEGKKEHAVALALGKAAEENSSLGTDLAAFLTLEHLVDGMHAFLETFENGELPALAYKIGAEQQLIPDVKRKFSKDYACLWNEETGKDLLRALAHEYRAAYATNAILHGSAHDWKTACMEWRERLRLFRIPAICVEEFEPALTDVTQMLLRIVRGETLLPPQIEEFAEKLQANAEPLRQLFSGEAEIFARVYASYLGGITPEGCSSIRMHLGQNFFKEAKQACFDKVCVAAEAYKKSEMTERLTALWRERTGTSNPRQWAEEYKMPVLSCVGADEFEHAQKALSLLEDTGGDRQALEKAFAFLEEATFFDTLASKEKREAAFRRDILGQYVTLLTDLDEVQKALLSLGIHPSAWHGNPRVKECLHQLARVKYAAVGAPLVQQKIDRMADTELKQYLKRLTADNMTVGMEILNS